jgi:hypothetical protein
VTDDGRCHHRGEFEIGVDSYDNYYRRCANCGESWIVSLTPSQRAAVRRAVFAPDGRRREHDPKESQILRVD